jgi:hypothetical protein
MDTGTVSPEVAAALISGGFVVLVALIEKSRRDNNRDHGQNALKLDRIETKLDDHIDNHNGRGSG